MTDCPFISIYETHFSFWKDLCSSDRDVICGGSSTVQYKKALLSTTAANVPV